MINIRMGMEADRQKILAYYPNVKNVLGENGYLLIAEIENDIVGFLWGFKRKIPAPGEQEEIFINIIEVIYTDLRCKGLGSQMVQKIIQMAKEMQVYQVRAYCDIQNVPSHRLWRKNKFSINPVKMPNDAIVGSFVSYVLY